MKMCRVKCSHRDSPSEKVGRSSQPRILADARIRLYTFSRTSLEAISAHRNCISRAHHGAVQSLNYREWSGYYTVGVYEVHHEHEYNAIRNSAALIDISPLFKYRITGHDATKLVNRVISRDITKVAVDQVIYCCWCDPDGKVIDDGTITRLGENDYRWTAADPSLRWFQQNALGLDVNIEDISEQTAALALQGPTSGSFFMRSPTRTLPTSNIFELRTAESPASQSTFPVRVIPAISATKSGCRGKTLCECGTN